MNFIKAWLISLLLKDSNVIITYRPSPDCEVVFEPEDRAVLRKKILMVVWCLVAVGYVGVVLFGFIPPRIEILGDILLIGALLFLIIS